MSEPSNDDPRYTSRQSNYDLLRDILSRQEGHGTQLAAITSQVAMLLELSKQTQGQVTDLSSRVELGNRDMITVRSRIDALEQRPIAMSAEERGEVTRTVREHEAAIGGTRQHLHELDSEIKRTRDARPLFDETELKNIHRLLDLAVRRNINDALDDTEIGNVRVMTKAWLDGNIQRVHRGRVLFNQGIWALFALVVAVLSGVGGYLLAHAAQHLK